LKRDKSTGFDNLINEYLITGKAYLIPILGKLFNNIINTGIDPELWVQSIIILVFKIKYSFIKLSNPVDLSRFKSRIPHSNYGSVKDTSSSSNTLSSDFGSLSLSMLLSCLFIRAYLIPILGKLFNNIINTGIDPELWVQSIIILVFKKGDVNEPKNYRGISLVSHVGKHFTDC
jgi:hypothetical protein